MGNKWMEQPIWRFVIKLLWKPLKNKYWILLDLDTTALSNYITPNELNSLLSWSYVLEKAQI